MTVFELPEDLIFIVWVVIALTVLGNMWTFDKLIRLEYSSHKASWEEDGKPYGFFYHPPEVGPRSSWARTKCAYAWLVWTPDWMKRDERARQLAFRLRVGILISFAGIAGWFALVFYVHDPLA